MTNKLKIYLVGVGFILLVMSGVVTFVTAEDTLTMEGRGWLVFLSFILNAFLLLLVGTMDKKDADELGDIFTCSWNKVQDKECKKEKEQE